MRHRIFFHIAWTTLDRRPLIRSETAIRLAELLPRLAREERGHLFAIGMVRSHVHTLVRVHPVTSIPRLVQRFKGSTARYTGIKWDKGYNIESVSIRAIETVKAYVEHQHLRHPEEVIDGWP